MDKEYLIHNIDYKDNPEDGHQTIDIVISNLELTEQDLTATIGLGMFVNGELAQSSEYEDVSLTGAGGTSPFLPIHLKIKKQGEVTISTVDTNILSDIENPTPDNAALLYSTLDCSELTEEYQDFTGYLPYILLDQDGSNLATIYAEYILQFLNSSNNRYSLTWVETENITDTGDSGFSIVDVSSPTSATIIVHD